MSRSIRKLWMATLLSLIMVIMLNGAVVYAAAAEMPGDPSAADEQEYGVLVVENLEGMGTVDVICEDMRDVFSYDYYELLIPLGKEVLIAIKPYPVYKIKSVSFGKRILKGSRGVYSIVVTEPFMTVGITYKAASNSSNGSDNNESGESTENKVHGSESSSGNKDSVSSISYDVEVTYLDTDDDKVVDIPNAREEVSGIPVEKPDSDNEISYMADSEEEMLGDAAGTEPVTAYETEPPSMEEKDTAMPVRNTEGIKSEDTDAKTEKDDLIMPSNDRTVSARKQIPENVNQEFDNSGNQEEKSVLILSNFPLYLFLVCCMILVKRKIQTKKVEIDG